MKTRSDRTPQSIWIIAIILVAIMVYPLFKQVAGGPSLITPVWLGMWAALFVVVLYHAIALVRLSRWPILLLAAEIGGSALIKAMSLRQGHFSWMTVGVISAPTAVILIVYLACTLPHWRKMNWAFLGRPYRPAAELEEVFA